jgi:hypothetical protein
MAASKPWRSSACRSAWVIITSVWCAEPWLNGADALRNPVGIDVDQKVEAELADPLIAKRDHVAKTSR